MSRSPTREPAQESEKTEKTRKKLLKRLAQWERRTTPHALKRKVAEIHRRLSRTAASRIPLKLKSFSLFDENRTPAALSNKVKQVIKNLKGNMFDQS